MDTFGLNGFGCALMIPSLLTITDGPTTPLALATDTLIPSIVIPATPGSRDEKRSVDVVEFARKLPLNSRYSSKAFKSRIVLNKFLEQYSGTENLNFCISSI